MEAAEASALNIILSPSQEDVTKYLVHAPGKGLVEVSREQCYDYMSQGEEASILSQAQTQRSAQPSTMSFQLNVSGIGGVEESTLPIDVVVSIDASGSMDQNDPDQHRLLAANFLIGKLNPSRDQAGFVSWNDRLVSFVPLSSNLTSVKEGIDNVGSTGQTDINVALREAISILDTNNRSEPSSEVIILITDGETDSSIQTDLTQEAVQKGYRIYPIGLGSQQPREELVEIAHFTQGQYYFPPSAANLQAAFDNITVDISNEPSSVNITDVTQSYIEIDYNSSFSIKQPRTERNLNNQTIMRWEDIGLYVGNNDSELSANETFSVSFLANLSSNMKKLNDTLPVRIEGESIIRYADRSGNEQTINIPQTYVNLTSHICMPKGDLRLVKDTFILPNSNNGTIGVYEQRKSNVFEPDEDIEFYIEYIGATQKMIKSDFDNPSYLANTTGNFTITDRQGRNIMNNTELFLVPFDVQVLSEATANRSAFQVFSYRPQHNIPLAPGDYIMTFSLIDNLSGERIEDATAFVIEPQSGPLSVLFDTFIVPGSANGTTGVYQARGSSIFQANEAFELYVELANVTQKRNGDEHENATNLTSDVSAILTIADEEGNLKRLPTYSEGFSAINRKDAWVSNSSYVFGFNPVSPSLKTGVYVMNFTIIDNLSGQNDSFSENVIIENNRDDALRALENATVALTNTIRALQDIMLKMVEE